MRVHNIRAGRFASALFAASTAVALVVAPAAAAPADQASERAHQASGQGKSHKDKPGKKNKGGALADLGEQIDVNAVNRHLVAFQRIADQNGGTRATGTPGYGASVDYVVNKLRNAGFSVSTPEFQYTRYVLESINLTVGGKDVEAGAMSYSVSTPEGGITAPLSVTPVDDSTGCQASDYDGTDVTDTIVLIKRGACTFYKKQEIAAAQGASAAIIYNNVEGALNGTLGSKGQIPTASVSKATGAELVEQAGTTATLDLQAHFEDITAENVIAETKTGRRDNVVMAGAHLDSVAEGAGINDNGSGSAALLETALQLGSSPDVNNAVRFAWWGAEESGLIGSTKYVKSLSFEQKLDIAMYLNFDMIGSPNAGYFVYDGDDSDNVGAGPGPYGSAAIEDSFIAALKQQGVESEGTDFTGRSDYGQFIAVGIPAGGLFTGAEGVKTEAQAEKWGGQAGVAYDPCYHQACDNLGNIDYTALERNSKAMADVVAKYAQSTEEVNGMQTRSERAAQRRQAMAAPTALSAQSESHGHSHQRARA